MNMPVDTTAPRKEGVLHEFGDLAIFCLLTLKSLPGAFRYSGEILRQFAILVRGTTHLVALLSLGAAFGLVNFGYYFLKSAGAADYTGLLVGVGSPRATVGMFLGYMFSAKIGCGYVAEIGAMKINQELDAYDTEGVGSRQFVVAPRVIATVLYTPIATGVVLLTTVAAGYVVAVGMLDAVSSETFYRYAWDNQAVFDQIYAFGVCLALGLTISLVATFYGTRAEGGPAGVGSAVARSLIVNLVLVHVIIGVGAFAVYRGDIGLPIGG